MVDEVDDFFLLERYYGCSLAPTSEAITHRDEVLVASFRHEERADNIDRPHHIAIRDHDWFRYAGVDWSGGLSAAAIAAGTNPALGAGVHAFPIVAMAELLDRRMP